MRHRPEDLIGLTVAGLLQVGAADYVEAFLATIGVACKKLREFSPSPVKVETLHITDEDVFEELAHRSMDSGLSSSELYVILEHEPPMWTGGRGLSPDGSWRWEVTREFRRYCGVDTIPRYVEVIAQAVEEIGHTVDSGFRPPDEASETIASNSMGAVTSSAFLGGQLLTPQVPLLGHGIDPELWEFVRPLVEAGRWEQVAREAAAFVETRARDWTNSRENALDLMSNILKPSRSTSGQRHEFSEEQGWHLIARGFFLAVRNHVAHNSIGLEEEFRYGLGALGTASLLAGRVRESVQRLDAKRSGEEASSAPTEES
jgi:hypothetical protein